VFCLCSVGVAVNKRSLSRATPSPLFLVEVSYCNAVQPEFLFLTFFWLGAFPCAFISRYFVLRVKRGGWLANQFRLVCRLKCELVYLDRDFSFSHK